MPKDTKDIVHIHVKSVDSTLVWTKNHYRELPPQKLSCFSSDSQSAGQGQFKRTWVSPDEGNIYATFFFTLSAKQTDFSKLTHLLASSAIKVMKQRNISCTIKWPNDLLLNQQKIGGILCHVFDYDKDLKGCALSIGFNVNMSKQSLSSVEQKATSLFIEYNKKFDPKAILKELIQTFNSDLAAFASVKVKT